MGYTSYLQKYEVIRVTPTLSTDAYSTGDVLFNSVEIPNAVREDGGCSKLINMFVVNQNMDVIDVNFFFSENSMTLGTINATANIADGDVEAGKILGTMKLDGDQTQTGGIDNAHVSMVMDAGGAGESGNPLLLQAAAGSTSVYVAGIITTGTPTLAADDIDLILHLEK